MLVVKRNSRGREALLRRGVVLAIDQALHSLMTSVITTATRCFPPRRAIVREDHKKAILAVPGGSDERYPVKIDGSA